MHVCWTQTQPSYLVVTVPMRGAFYPLTVCCHLFSGCSLIHRPAGETKQEDRDTREDVAHLFNAEEKKQAGKMKAWNSSVRQKRTKNYKENPSTYDSKSNLKV